MGNLSLKQVILGTLKSQRHDKDNEPSPDHQYASNEANYSPDSPKTVPVADQLFDPVLNVNRVEICESKQEDEEYDKVLAIYRVRLERRKSCCWFRGFI